MRKQLARLGVLIYHLIAGLLHWQGQRETRATVSVSKVRTTKFIDNSGLLLSTTDKETINKET